MRSTAEAVLTFVAQVGVVMISLSARHASREHVGAQACGANSSDEAVLRKTVALLKSWGGGGDGAAGFGVTISVLATSVGSLYELLFQLVSYPSLPWCIAY
jgi:hypothetical protein